jgi:hypothetical protein
MRHSMGVENYFLLLYFDFLLVSRTMAIHFRLPNYRSSFQLDFQQLS